MSVTSYAAVVDRWPLGVRIFLFGAAYFGCAWLGDVLTLRPSNFTPFWPVSGLFVAVLLLTRPREWPGMLLGALCANLAFDLLHGRPLLMSLGFSLGNSLEALAGAGLVRRFTTGKLTLTSPKEVIILLVFSAAISTTISATIGTLTLTALVGLENVPLTWLTWWTGDSLGVLVMAPLLLNLSQRPLQSLKGKPILFWLEAMGYALLIVVLVWNTFSNLEWVGLKGVYLVIPLMVFVTLRYGMTGMVLAGFQLSCLVILRVSNSPLAVDYEQLLSVQVFLATILFMGLVLSAVLTQNQQERLALQISEERFRSVLESSLDAAYRRDLYTDLYDYLSPAIESITGWSTTEMTSATTETILGRIHPQDAPRVVAAIERSIATNRGQSKSSEILQYRMLGKDGKYRWLEDHFTLLTDSQGRPRYRLGIVRNATARILVEEALRLSEAKFRVIFEEAPIGMALVGEDFRFISINAAFCRMLGYKTTELIGLSFPQITHPEHIAQDVANVQKLMRGEIAIYHTEKRYVRKDGGIVNADLTLTLNRDAEGNFLHLLAMVEDISERVHLLAELENRARHDELTGALNRWGLLNVIQIELERARRYHHPVGLILFDFDHFKQVNDTYGHAAGDFVLHEVTQLCLDVIRSGDSLARYGGDEFVILLPETSLELASQAAERLRQIIAKHVFEFEGIQFQLTISLGVCVDQTNQFTLEHFLRSADRALYAAKEAGKNCVHAENYPYP